MPFPIQLDEQQYSALVSLARAGTKDIAGNPIPEKARRLEEFLKGLERQSDIERSILLIQWQETDHLLPPGTNFPTKWPPEQRFLLELVSRPISKDDVMKVLDARARKPTNVLVTKDPAGLVGWATLNSYFNV